MKKLLFLALLILACSHRASAQSATNGNGAPGGSCSKGALYTDNQTGNVYSCNSSTGTGVWQLAGGGSSGIVSCTTTGGVLFENGTNNTATCGANFTYNSTTGTQETQCDIITIGMNGNCVVNSLTGTVTGSVGDTPATESGMAITINSPNTTPDLYSGYFGGALGLGSGTFTGAPSGVDLAGIIGSTGYQGTGTVTTMAGLFALTGANTGGGTVTNNFGVYGGDQHGVGSTLNAAFYAPDQGTGANDYAMYLAGGKTFMGGAVLSNSTNLTTADINQFGAPGNQTSVFSNVQLIDTPSASFGGTAPIATVSSAYMNDHTGGLFTAANKTSYNVFSAVINGSAYGQHTAYNTNVNGYGLGDAFAEGGSIGCWGGGFVAATSEPLCGGFEYNIGEGTTTFTSQVSGSPGASATVITYKSASNESVLGSRFILNLTQTTTAGTTSSISGTTVTTGSSPVWDNAAGVCSGTGAGVHCNPIGEYYKVNASDVTINAVSIGHWYKITAVISGTQFTLENSYDTTDLATSGAYTIAEGSEIQNFDTTAKTITILANSYTWANNDNLQSPPNHQTNIQAFHIIFTHSFKTRQPTTADRAFQITANGNPMDTIMYFDGSGGWNEGIFFGSPLGTGIEFGSGITGKGMFFDVTCNNGCSPSTTQFMGRNGGANGGTIAFGQGDTINWQTGGSDTALSVDNTTKAVFESVAGATASALCTAGVACSATSLALTGSAPTITAPGTTPYINMSGPLEQRTQCSFALTTGTFTLALSPVNLCTITLPNAAVVWRVNCNAGWSNPAGTTPTFAVGNNWAQTPSGVAAGANIGTTNAGVAVEGYTAATTNSNIVATGTLTNSATIFPVTWWTTFTGSATSGAYHPTASLTGTGATGTLVGFCTIQ